MILTTFEEKELFLQYHTNHDIKIRDKIIRKNTGLVMSIARQLYRRRADLTFNDILQEGKVGLILAFDKFDLTFGVKFSTYASYYIKMRIRQAYKNTFIRVPAHVYRIKDPNNKFFKAKNKIGFTDSYMEDLSYIPNDIDEDIIIINMSGLNEKEVFIINNRYGINGYNKLTLKEVAELLDISREWVRKIELDALRKLRRNVEMENYFLF